MCERKSDMFIILAVSHYKIKRRSITVERYNDGLPYKYLTIPTIIILVYYYNHSHKVYFNIHAFNIIFTMLNELLE